MLILNILGEEVMYGSLAWFWIIKFDCSYVFAMKIFQLCQFVCISIVFKYKPDDRGAQLTKRNERNTDNP